MSKVEVDPGFQGAMIRSSPAGEVINTVVFPERPREKMLGWQACKNTYFGPEGTYVDLIDRAEELDLALAAFSQRNQRLGFDVASNEKRHNGPIYWRYRRNVPFVQRGAENNTQKFLEEAKKHLWQASGYSALRSTRLMSKRSLEARARIMWEDFSSEYGTPLHVKERATYRKTLKKGAQLAMKAVGIEKLEAA